MLCLGFFSYIAQTSLGKEMPLVMRHLRAATDTRHSVIKNTLATLSRHGWIALSTPQSRQPVVRCLLTMGKKYIRALQASESVRETVKRSRKRIHWTTIDGKRRKTYVTKTKKERALRLYDIGLLCVFIDHCTHKQEDGSFLGRFGIRQLSRMSKSSHVTIAKGVARLAERGVIRALKTEKDGYKISIDIKSHIA